MGERETDADAYTFERRRVNKHRHVGKQKRRIRRQRAASPASLLLCHRVGASAMTTTRRARSCRSQVNSIAGWIVTHASTSAINSAAAADGRAGCGGTSGKPSRGWRYTITGNAGPLPRKDRAHPTGKHSARAASSPITSTPFGGVTERRRRWPRIALPVVETGSRSCCRANPCCMCQAPRRKPSSAYLEPGSSASSSQRHDSLSRSPRPRVELVVELIRARPLGCALPPNSGCAPRPAAGRVRRSDARAIGDDRLLCNGSLFPAELTRRFPAPAFRDCRADGRSRR